MKVKFSPVSQQIRNWAVPLFSVATFIPLWVAYLASSEPETPKTRLSPVIPLPSPLADVLPSPLARPVIKRSIPDRPTSIG
jgi:hypothetical protein